MNTQEAIQQLQRIAGQSRGRSLKLCVQVFRPGSLGGTPCVAIKDIQSGFDWDAGKVLLTTEVNLTTLSPEDMEAIHESTRKGQSWHAYQAHKEMKEKLEAAEGLVDSLQAEIKALRAQLGMAPT